MTFPPQIVMMIIQTNDFGRDSMTNLDDFITDVELVGFLFHYMLQSNGSGIPLGISEVNLL